MGKFKVGDSIEIVKGGRWTRVGDVGQITELPNDKSGAVASFPHDGCVPLQWYEFKLHQPKLTKNQRLTSLEQRVSNLEEIAKQLQENNITIDDVKKYFTLPSTVEIDGKQLSAASIIGMTIESSAVNSPFGTEVGRDLEAEYVEQARVEEDYKVHDEVIEFEGNKYQKVGREAREGDVVVFTAEQAEETTDVTPGKPYKVCMREGSRDLWFQCDDSVYYGVYRPCYKRTYDTVDVYELIQPSTTSTVESKQDVHSTTFTLGGKHSDDHNAVQDVQRQTVPCAAAKTPNELRAEVIEKAKAFIGNSKTTFTAEAENGPYKGQIVTFENVYSRRLSPFKRTACEVEFITNAEKGKVVALLRGIDSQRVYHKGIAYCSKGDVFNEHIGKAIALGRALGLDVSEFEQAVQPTLARGQIVQRYKVTEDEILEVDFVDGIRIKNNPIRVFMKEDGDRIINDTNAIYGGVE